MKEETNINLISRTKEQISVQWSFIDRGLSNSNQNINSPKSRFKHQSFIYNKILYVYGGTTIPMNEIFDDPLDIYTFNLDKGSGVRWQKTKIKCNSKDLQQVSGHAGVLQGNRWFMFGGTNSEFKCNNFLWRLNLDTLQMVKLDNKGEVPTPRESANLFFFDHNWLLLYGGVSINNVQIYNTFHCYNIDTKIWSKCQGTYMYQANPRYDAALYLANGKIYIFGGTYRNNQGEEMYLNDFYEVLVTPAGASTKIEMKRLKSQVMPQARSGHAMIQMDTYHLLLMGGQNSCLQVKDGMRTDDITIVNSMWIYSIDKNIWSKLAVNNSQNFKYRTQFSLNKLSDDKFFLFGGMYSYSHVYNDIIQLQIPIESLKDIPYSDTVCAKCEEKRIFIRQQHYISAEIIQEIADNIEFPFAAFGLLIDNATNHSANFVNIYYHQNFGHQKRRLLRFQDNAKLPWTDEQFYSLMSNFGGGALLIPIGIDKKTKATIVRDNLKREYGNNVKIASLKLGSGFLHISSSENGQQTRVCLFKKQKGQRANERYVLLYYSYSSLTKICKIPQMEAVRRHVESEFIDLIEDASSQYEANNTFFIFDPKIMDLKNGEEEEIQLKISTAYNDIINGSIDDFNALEKAGYNITDCVDVSLRAYIVCLYLKNETTRISLTVRNSDPNPIPTQVYLQKVDKLCKYKYVLEINSVIEFEFKIVELYYLYDLKKRLSYFNNGLLIYHKNRLISRYKYPLGQLISRKMYKMQGNYNLTRLFGFIELPDHVPINIFKTNVCHSIMTEKLFSRLKFVNKMFKKQLQRLVLQGNLKRTAPTKLSANQMAEDYRQNVEFKPKPRGTVSRQRKVVPAVSSLKPKRGQVNRQHYGVKQVQKQQKRQEVQKELNNAKQQNESSIQKLQNQNMNVSGKGVPMNVNIEQKEQRQYNDWIEEQRKQNNGQINGVMDEQNSVSSSSQSQEQEMMEQMEGQILLQHISKEDEQRIVFQQQIHIKEQKQYKFQNQEQNNQQPSQKQGISISKQCHAPILSKNGSELFVDKLLKNQLFEDRPRFVINNSDLMKAKKDRVSAVNPELKKEEQNSPKNNKQQELNGHGNDV